MATADLNDLVTATKSKAEARCRDCSWYMRSTVTQTQNSGQLHAAWATGHRVVVTVTTETAYQLP